MIAQVIVEDVTAKFTAKYGHAPEIYPVVISDFNSQHATANAIATNPKNRVLILIFHYPKSVSGTTSKFVILSVYEIMSIEVTICYEKNDLVFCTYVTSLSHESNLPQILSTFISA